MKKIYLLLLLSFLNTYSQEETDKLSYSEVMTVEGISKQELYNRGKLWFAKAFNSANNVIQLDDKESGEIVGKALFIYKPSMLSASEQTKGPVRYTVSLSFKDGRYKYEVTDFNHDPAGNSYGSISVGVITKDDQYPEEKAKNKKLKDKVWQDIKKQIENEILPLIANLKESMSKTAETKKNDW